MTEVLVTESTHVVLVQSAGPTQLITVGIVGPQGPAGSIGGHTHPQPSPSSTWTIPHHFGRTPFAVTVTLLSGEIVEANRADLDTNTTQLTFSSPAAGTAVLI